MSFFVMPYTFTVMGRFKMVQSLSALSLSAVSSRPNCSGHHALVFYRSVHVHLFETPLNGPLFWTFDKKRHTHAPSLAP